MPLDAHVYEPETKLLTIMFVDIVGYSRVAETHNAKECFADLRDILGCIATNVEKYGGVVDKTLGDGMICYFGQEDWAESSISINHADQAVACAVAIQRDSLDLTFRAHLKGKPIYPLRIGINTAEVLVGNLGASSTHEVTLIGHGVNMANRLEAACDGYSIMVGPDTHTMLTCLERLDIKPRQRFIHVKHHDLLDEAYECNPFEDQPEMLNKAMCAYQSFLGLKRLNERWPVPMGAHVRVMTEAGEGELIDFSEGGIGLRLPTFLGRGVQLNLSLVVPDQELTKRLEEEGLKKLIGEVRWGRPTGSGYMHGFQLKFQDQEVGHKLVRILKEALLQ